MNLCKSDPMLRYLLLLQIPDSLKSDNEVTDGNILLSPKKKRSDRRFVQTSLVIYFHFPTERVLNQLVVLVCPV